MKPIELTRLINKYALIDIDCPAAYHKKSSLKHLPDSAEEILKVIHPKHSQLISKYLLGTPVICHNVNQFNPIERLFYYDKNLTDDEYSAVKSFFLAHTVSVVTGKGEYIKNINNGFQFDWFVILDTTHEVIFSFVFNLQD